MWTAPGFLEGKGLPIPFFQQLISSMRPRCRALGKLGAAGPRGISCGGKVRQPRMPGWFAEAAGGRLLPQLLHPCRARLVRAGVDPLPAELLGQVESELLAVTFFLELAVVLPRYKALLLSDTGGDHRSCLPAAEAWR